MEERKDTTQKHILTRSCGREEWSPIIQLYDPLFCLAYGVLADLNTWQVSIVQTIHLNRTLELIKVELFCEQIIDRLRLGSTIV